MIKQMQRCGGFLLIIALLTSSVFAEAGETRAQRQSRELLAAETGCNAGNTNACVDLGNIYLDGKDGIKKDPAHGIDLLEKACKLGSRMACYGAGVRLSSEWDGSPEDDPRAARLLKTACDGSFADYPIRPGAIVYALIGPLGCANLKGMANQGKGVTRFKDGSLMIFDATCEEADSRDCPAISIMYYTGEGRSNDERKTLTSYQIACEAGDGKACFDLGYLYEDGEVIDAVNPKATALTLLQKACDAGQARGCSNLGAMYLRGYGTPVDKTRAEKLFGEACERGDAGACFNQASMYTSTVGVGIDMARARQLFDKASSLDISNRNLRDKIALVLNGH